MKKALILSVMGGFIISLALVSCKKDEKISDPTPVQPPVNVLTTSLSGLGFHGGQPSGASFILPSNIKIIGDITGGYYGGKSFVGDKNKENFKTYLTSLESSKLDFTQYGYGTYVNLYMELKNTSNFSYDFEIPAGTILCNEDPDTTDHDTTQSGFVIQTLKINIPANETVGILLNTFCLNLHFGCPGPSDRYVFKVVSNNDQLKKVTNALKNKNSLNDNLYEIQEILWKITDGEGISQEDIDLMNSWQ